MEALCSLCPVERACEAFRASPIFGAAVPAVRETLARRVSGVRLGEGEPLRCHGPRCRGLCLVVEGSLAVALEGRGARALGLGSLCAGGHLGGAIGLAGGASHAVGRAAAPAVVACIPEADLEPLLSAQPGIARAFLIFLAALERRLTDLMADATLKTVRQRLAGCLLERAAAACRPDASGVFLPPRKAVALELGTAREVVSRELHRLARAGTIAVRGPRIEILDPKALAAQALG